MVTYIRGNPFRSWPEAAGRLCCAQVMLVAVHPWDCHGARQAGLQAGFVNRDSVHYPPYFDAPNAEAADLLLLVNQCILAMPTE